MAPQLPRGESDKRRSSAVLVRIKGPVSKRNWAVTASSKKRAGILSLKIIHVANGFSAAFFGVEGSAVPPNVLKSTYMA